MFGGDGLGASESGGEQSVVSEEIDFAWQAAARLEQGFLCGRLEEVEFGSSATKTKGEIGGELLASEGAEGRCCTARSKSLTSLMPVAESPGAVRIGHPERGHLVEYLAPNSVFNSLPRQRSCSHLRPDDRFVTIDRVLHHASLGEA